MYRLPGCVVLALVCSSAFAQNADNTSILDRSPSENAAPGNAAARGPASWVTRARARHSQLIQDRVTANPQSVDRSDDPRIFGNSGSSGSTGGVDLLGGLAGLLGGGTSGALDDLLGLADSFGIDTSSFTGQASGLQTPTGGESGILSQDDVAAAGAEDALAQLLALRDGLEGDDSRYQVRDDATGGEEFTSFGFLKDDPRAQQAGDDGGPSFRVRLYDSWLNTVFTSLTIGLQTPQVIDAMADGLRSIFGIPDPGAADASGADTGAGSSDGANAGGGSNSDGGTGGSGSPGNTGTGNAIDNLGDGSIV